MIPRISPRGPLRSVRSLPVRAQVVCRNTEVTWSRTTRKADARRGPTDVFLSATTTPSRTYIRPGRRGEPGEPAPTRAMPRGPGPHRRIAELDVIAGQVRRRVSRSLAFSASCQARTVAISDVRHGVQTYRRIRTVCGPARMPDRCVAEDVEAGVADGLSASERQQQILRVSTQRDVALGVLVRPRDVRRRWSTLRWCSDRCRRRAGGSCPTAPHRDSWRDPAIR